MLVPAKIGEQLKQSCELLQNPIKFESIQWKEWDACHYIGNQLLHAEVAMYQDKDFFPPDNGVGLSIDWKPDSRIYCILSMDISWKHW